MRIVIAVFFITLTGIAFCQYPFEKYPAIKYKKYVGKKYEKDGVEHYTLTIPGFFTNKESLTLEIMQGDSFFQSNFSLYRNKELVKRFIEPIFFTDINFEDTVYVADINGDSLPDIKLVLWYEGSGLAVLNMRVIYLFQIEDDRFTRISYLDKIEGSATERDFDGDGNYEIITMKIQEHKGHNYRLFNLYHFNGQGLVNVSDKFDYPIMIQYLYRNNYEITDKISPEGMKKYTIKNLPEYLNR